MALQFNHTSGFTKLVIIGELLVVSYLLYTLTVSVYKSYQIDQHILSFQKENERIAMENKQKELDYSYYSSEAHYDLVAKQNLGLINPGEEVIAIVDDETQGSGVVGGIDGEENASGINLNGLSNAKKWWKFFFDMKS